MLIYVVIHANPPQLVSNLLYIERFRMHSRMQSESAYFFTQLVRADGSFHAQWHPLPDGLSSFRPLQQ